MPCDLGIINADVTLDCSDVPVGGLTQVLVMKYEDLTAVTEVDGEVTWNLYRLDTRPNELELRYVNPIATGLPVQQSSTQTQANPLTSAMGGALIGSKFGTTGAMIGGGLGFLGGLL